MKRYLLFFGGQYYPYGGWDDLRGDFLSLDEARHAAEELARQSASTFLWAHVIDLEQDPPSEVASGGQNERGVFSWDQEGERP